MGSRGEMVGRVWMRIEAEEEAIYDMDNSIDMRCSGSMFEDDTHTFLMRSYVISSEVFNPKTYLVFRLQQSRCAVFILRIACGCFIKRIILEVIAPFCSVVFVQHLHQSSIPESYSS